jgi:hypothetical protein
MTRAVSFVSQGGYGIFPDAAPASLP